MKLLHECYGHATIVQAASNDHVVKVCGFMGWVLPEDESSMSYEDALLLTPSGIKVRAMVCDRLNNALNCPNISIRYLHVSKATGQATNGSEPQERNSRRQNSLSWEGQAIQAGKARGSHLALQQPPNSGSAARLNASTSTSLKGALAQLSSNCRKLFGHRVTSLGQRE